MQLIPTKEDELKKEADKRHQLAVLANEKVLLNDTIGANRTLKVQIDIMRKEIFFARDQNQKMEGQIQKLKKDITESAHDSINSNRIAGETNN